MKSWALRLALVLIILSVASGGWATQEEKSEWSYAITPYLWFAGLDGKVTARGNEAPVDLGFSDIWDDLDLAFMGRFEAWKNNWGYFIDLLYIDLTDTVVAPRRTIDWDVDMWIVEAGMGYRLKSFVTEKGLPGYLDLLGGLRYYDMETSVYPADLPGGSGGEDWIDVYLGPRLIYPMSEKWNFLFRGDIGTGDSDLSWSLMAGFQFKKSDSFSLALVYSILDIDYETGSGSSKNAFDAQMSGPALALTWYW